MIDKSFGFDSAVEEAQRAINAAHVESESIENGIGVVKVMVAHVESESIENGIGVVKVMGRYSGKFLL